MSKRNIQSDTTQADRLLESRVSDAFDGASSYSKRYVGFLDPHESSIVLLKVRRLSQIAVYDGCSSVFWGGYDGAERVFFGVFPPYDTACNDDFPITAIDITWRFATLSHRDFLGALLALGIAHNKIGDIVVGDGRCTVFAEKTVAEFIFQNLMKVGSAGVTCLIANGEVAIREEHFGEIGGTVASSRLDCIISALIGLSRSSSAELISGGLVSVDFEATCNISALVGEGATVSIRGHGRFVIDRIGPQTKKGRLTFAARKYL
jgi:RNA-binding protein YlmH